MILKVRDSDGTVRTTTLLPQPPKASGDHIARMEGDLLYVRFLSFEPGTTDWVQAQIDAHPGPRGMILDLRGNVGGSLSEAVKMLALFLDQPFHFGRMTSRVPRHDEGCNRPLETRASNKRFSAPVVILIDRYSFSSAELVSAAMQSHGRAEIVGETSGGEVTCMSTVRLPDGGGLRVGVAAYVTAEGRPLNHVGVTPDHRVTVSPDRRRAGPDIALAEARRLLATPSE